ncbi:hypothetical protein EV195_105243 [Tenacibaculum skagerrakense]|uniref:Uncharacterized protein n=1 Tax=Tenacibaculum skagerrakense TaxID=186571 RepID=A0A4R2NSQ1_9FLAO|nr:hypothetical protein [Tenacibaculum skagerrakense]TCP24812.1 hypothetical protein EV195_105243 [Tenacibaculum skagerrakense]
MKKIAEFNENQISKSKLQMTTGGTSTTRDSSTNINTSTNVNLGSNVVGVAITDPEMIDGDITDPEIDDAVSANYSNV